MDWSDRAAIEGLRIADFACGTGALLSAAQRAVYRRYRRAGGDDKDLHRPLMEHVLTGLDVMPAATHLTCSMLSSSHPSLAYGESQIHTMPYGIDGGGTHIGALDLLNSNHSYSLFATGESMSGMKSDSRSGYSVTIKDKSCDLVIMNPPFTRPTNHEAGLVHRDINGGPTDRNKTGPPQGPFIVRSIRPGEVPTPACCLILGGRVRHPGARTFPRARCIRISPRPIVRHSAIPS